MRRELAWAALGLALAAPAWGQGGAIEGRVSVRLEGLTLANVAPVVVFLEPEGGPHPVAASGPPASVRQSQARFQPGFLAVAVGQSVEMRNDDAIYHNVFSYSRPNDFDLGLYPAGESRIVTFRHPGVVKTYCSIHEQMNGTILVAPSPWFSVVSAAGRFALRDVPAGRYRLVGWSERLPRTSLPVELSAGQRLERDLTLGGPPQAARAGGAPGSPTPLPAEPRD